MTDWPSPQTVASGTSLEDVYLQSLWDLHAAAAIMRIKLIEMVAAVSDHRLATVLREGRSSVGTALDGLDQITHQFHAPARSHAEELETLTGYAARQIPGMPPGRVRDVAVASTVRLAAHYAMPLYELCELLAGTLGYSEHVVAIKRLGTTVRNFDTTVWSAIGEIVSGRGGADESGGT